MLGKNLEEILKAKEITLTELAKATSVPRTTLIGWVKGTSASPNLEQLDRVSSYLKVSIEELAFGRKKNNQSSQIYLIVPPFTRDYSNLQ